MQLVCQLREKEETDIGAELFMFPEVGSKTEDTRLALTTPPVILRSLETLPKCVVDASALCL